MDLDSTPVCPFERRFPLCQEIASALGECRAAITPYFECCPILQGPPENPVLASDGYVYDREALRAWMRTCVERRDPIHSPVSRTILRASVCPTTLDRAIEAEVECRNHRAGSGTLLTHSFALIPPRHPNGFANVRSGSARCSRWSSKAGSLIRMLLDWASDDIVEWVCPIEVDAHSAQVSIATPPPAIGLLVIAQEVARWLSISESEFTNPTHILTAYFSKRTPGAHPPTPHPPLTLEAMLLKHRRRRRTRSRSPHSSSRGTF